MSYPLLDDPFDSQFSIYSIPKKDFTIPNHFDVFLPDSQDGCLGALVASAARGATSYIRNGKYLIIGIYADSGRLPITGIAQPNRYWTRVGNILTIDTTTYFNVELQARVSNSVPPFANNPTYSYPSIYEFVSLGEQIKLTGVDSTLSIFTVTEITSTTFSVYAPPLSGAADLSANNLATPVELTKDFSITNIVFRILPSFKLVPYAEILGIFESTSPTTSNNTSYITNLTPVITAQASTGFVIQTPPLTSSSNYRYANIRDRLEPIESSLPRITISPKIQIPEFENEQIFDSDSNALPLRYDSHGQVIKTFYFDSANKTNTSFTVPPIRDMNGDVVVDGDGFAFTLYDFYGFKLTRARQRQNAIPFGISDSDPSSPLRRFLPFNGTSFINMKSFFDVFANNVIGILSYPTGPIIAKRQLMPLALNNFGYPKKSPQPR